jgi:hypothetical protein
MSRRFSLQIIVPIKGYEEDRIYDEDEIELKYTYDANMPENAYYKRLKSRSVYAAHDDIVAFAKEKYQLDELRGYSMSTNWLGECKICVNDNRYIVEVDEVKQLEKEHISDYVYCNEFKHLSLSWFYTSIGDEFVLDDFAVVNDELIQKAAELLGYKSDEDLVKGLAYIFEHNADQEDKFMASLILGKEMANRMNGIAILRYE